MKYILIVILSVLFIATVAAQTPPSMGAPNVQGFVFKLDKTSGTIRLFKGQAEEVGANYKITMIEIEIFDAKGEYTGTLELKELTLPKAEVESYEHLKIASVKMKDAKTGEEITLNNVAVGDLTK